MEEYLQKKGLDVDAKYFYKLTPIFVYFVSIPDTKVIVKFALLLITNSHYYNQAADDVDFKSTVRRRYCIILNVFNIELTDDNAFHSTDAFKYLNTVLYLLPLSQVILFLISFSVI